MAATATTPLLTELPSPPLPTDAEASFDIKAGASLTAQVQMVAQINTALAWQAASMAATLDYKTAAGASAAQSALAASTASLAKEAAQKAVTDTGTAGARQVQLATDQVALAVVARQETQAIATAVGVSAGVPPARTPFTTLSINAAGNVMWEWGLPNRAVGKTGQSVMLDAAKKPYWGYAGQQIGDTLITSRNPGGLYLPANGSIRSKSVYPVAAAQIGLIGGVVGEAWQASDSGLSSALRLLKSNGKGTLIAMIAASLTLTRSVDGGVTWTPCTMPGGLGSSSGTTSIDTDLNGNWVICGFNDSAAPRKVLRSEDDGITWEAVNIPVAQAGGDWTHIVCAGPRIFLALTNYGVSALRSTDGGATWNAVVIGIPSNAYPYSIGSNLAGTVLVSTATTLFRSTDYGATWVNTGIANIYGIGTDRQGTWLLTGTNSQTHTRRSLDDALTFTAFPLGATAVALNNILFAYGKIFINTQSGQGVYVYRPADGTFAAMSSANGLVYGPVLDAANGLLLALGSGQAGARLVKAPPVFGYDTANQFALPSLPAPPGLTAYIKVLEAA